MTFIGSLSVATAGREEVRTVMIAALGCNLAWGLADAVMYLVGTLTERTRNRTLLARLRGGADAAEGQRLVAEVLPPGLAAAAGPDGLEALRRRLVELPTLPTRPHLGRDDFKGALGVFLLVVAATFPLVVPFMLLDQTALAVRVSNLVALGTLFLAGWILARYAGGNRWRAGAGMAVVGAVLVGAIMALGG
jgi:VIT1/CCC1 family predicted Fe2+/Mn2+ transporter